MSFDLDVRGKDANAAMNRVGKKTPRIMLQGLITPNAEVGVKGSECTIHTRNLQKLMMLKIYTCLNAENQFLCGKDVA